jgi:Uma2 family endonuclease
MTPRQRGTPHHTYGEYLTWPDDPQQELIDGIAYVREPPAPSRYHQEIVGELHFQVRQALRGKPCRVYVAPFDVRLPKADEANELIDSVVQPDVLIVCDRQKLDERGMRGAPDWIAEVLSPGTAEYDRMIKVPLYERSGVPELWLIHPTDRTVAIYRLSESRYGLPTVLKLSGRTDLTAVPGVSIDWDGLLSQLVP